MSKDKSQKVWGASPAGSTFGEGHTPGSKEFFQSVIERRSSREFPWLYSLIPFSRYKGKKVLELGCGAGYDAYEFCQNGANYTGIDITPENPDRVRLHLKHFGFEPRVMVGDAESLTFDDESFDVVYSNGVLHHTPSIEDSFSEASRVLRKEGDFWVILYHRDSLFYWLNLYLCDYLLKGGYRKSSFKERLSQIEYTTSGELPLVNVYSRGQLRKLLKEAGFLVKETWVRKLNIEDLASVPLVGGKLGQLIPPTVLSFVGRWFGWYVIAHAVKK